MTAPAEFGLLAQRIGGGREVRLLVTVFVLYCALVASLLPYAREQWLRMPQASAIFAVAMMIAHGLTALLLSFDYRTHHYGVKIWKMT